MQRRQTDSSRRSPNYRVILTTLNNENVDCSFSPRNMNYNYECDSYSPVTNIQHQKCKQRKLGK